MSLLTLVIVMLAINGFARLRSRLSARIVATHAAAAVLVAINWGTFIIASIEGHVIESGIGYLIAPFVAITVGGLLFREPMSRLRMIGLGVIATAVLGLLNASGELSHWVYLTIGATWGGYACLKKITPLNSFSGLFIETLVLVTLLPCLLASDAINLELPREMPSASIFLLAICGFVSVIPLWLFSYAASGLALSIMGSSSLYCPPRSSSSPWRFTANRFRLPR